MYGLTIKMKRVDDYTKLKPYNPTLYSPVKRLARTGELGILLTHPRGYAVVVVSLLGDKALVRFLDDDPSIEGTWLDLHGIIPTGKRPDDLTTLYEPTPISLDEALDKERGEVDWKALTARKSRGKSAKGTRAASPNKKKKFDIKNLTKEQKELLKTFLMGQLKKKET